MDTTQIFHLLKWQSNTPPIIDDLVEFHYNDVKHRVAHLLWIAEDIHLKLYDKCKALIDAIPEQLISKLYLCPIIYRVTNDYLADKQSESLERFHDLLTGLILTHSTMDGDIKGWRKEVWSPLADRKRSYRKNGIKDTHNSTLLDCIYVDFDSPLATRIDNQSGVMNKEPVIITALEKETILEKLKEACTIIDDVCSITGRFLRNYTRIIHCRKSHSEEISSEQVPQEIGSIRLLNVQNSRFSIVDLIDNLIHESTHNFLSMYEARNDSFVRENNTRYKPVSPWSGNPIPIHSLTHAIPIYFSIFNFMNMMRKKHSDTPLGISAVEKMFTCASGFRYSQNLSKYFIDVDSCVNDELKVMYDSMKKYVVDSIELEVKNEGYVLSRAC